MTDLATFLLARIAEDESEARKAGDRFGGGPWEYDGNYNVAGHPPFGGPVRASVQDPNIGRHIARWDPARVLAECDAKRRIVNTWESLASLDRNPGPDYSKLDVDLNRLEWTLCVLALPYADHADYDQEWRP